jgi:hypothetical protein
MLNCSLKRSLIWGTLSFACSFDRAKQELVYDSSANDYISDSYEIRIDFNQPDTFGFPKVYEESGIIKKFANDSAIKLEDLHINKDDDDSCCLGIFPEYQWQGALAYILDKVIPFFYWQSYRRNNGKEPWKTYSHGNAGIQEAMSLSPSQSSKGCSRNIKCPCGSGRKYKKCCMGRDAILNSKLRRAIRRTS